MCGIVGYAGTKNAAEVLIDGLRHLEYRGYDSAGIAVFEKDGIHVVKSKGRLDDLEAKMQQGGCPKGTTGIGHTRWATHGEPSDINSHPHGNKVVSIVHNGIIENYMEIKAFLEEKGYIFCLLYTSILNRRTTGKVLKTLPKRCIITCTENGKRRM